MIAGSVYAAREVDAATGAVAVSGAAGPTGTTAAGDAPASPVGGAPRGGPWWYDVYGLHIRSDVRLPLGDAGPRVQTADVEYVLRDAADRVPAPNGQVVASQPCGLHGFDMLVHRGQAGETWIWHRAIATCHVLPGAHRVDVYPEPEVDEDVLGLLLIGQVAVFVLHQLGTPTLHASATVTERGGVAFLGPKGQGKSTMVAAFLKRGATLLTDDVLPLSVDEKTGVYGSPSLPIMKLWQQTVESTLELGEELPDLVANYDKKLLRVDGRYEFAAAPARLRAFYVLNRYDPSAHGADGTTRISSRPLAGREAIAAVRS